MCGRYYIDTLPEQIANHFDLHQTPDFVARYNVAPTDMMPIILQRGDDRRCGPARWGLIPFWAKDHKIGYKTINARSESVASKPAFREAFARRRCIVPASGFYEWKKMADGKQPFAIRRKDQQPLAFGGLWERWKRGPDDVVVSFSIVTTTAEGPITELHDRMPVILPPDRYLPWMTGSPEEAARDFVPSCGDELEFYPVSREVNAVKNDHPGLIEHVSLQ